MSPEERGAVAGLLRCGYEFREVPLSPAEAWEKSRGALRPLPGYLAPAVLGAALRCTAKVRQDLQFRYRDPNAGQEFTVEARAGGELLPRGAEYHLWVNPLDAGRAYVADTDGRYVGEARVVRAVRADAPPEELAEQLAMRRRAIADERRRLAPLARRRLEAANGRAAANLAALGLEDPAGRAALERAARAELAAAGDGAADGFEVAPPDAPGGGISDEDFASAALAAPEGGDDFPG